MRWKGVVTVHRQCHLVNDGGRREGNNLMTLGVNSNKGALPRHKKTENIG